MQKEVFFLTIPFVFLGFGCFFPGMNTPKIPTIFDIQSPNFECFTIAGRWIEDLVWLPNGEKIVYIKETKESRSEIWIIDADGTNPQKIFQTEKEGEWCHSISISPDGKKVLFSQKEEKGIVYNLWLMHLDNMNVRMFIENANRGIWTPDGSKIIYTTYVSTSQNGEEKMILFDLKTSERKYLTSVTKSFSGIAISPQGDKISFSCNDDLYIMNIDGTDKRIISPEARDPCFSPDGKMVVFTKIAFPRYILAVIDIEGNSLSILDEVLEEKYRCQCLCPKWSPDGKRIAFIGGKFTHQIPVTLRHLFILHLTPSLVPGKKGGGE